MPYRSLCPSALSRRHTPNTYTSQSKVPAVLLEEYRRSDPASGPLSDRLEALAQKSPVEIAASRRNTMKHLEAKVMTLINVINKT
ncbi:hypothetical protein CONLIGDRAFT_628831 [Coniochaeta ligniaria NRRL 30616]|uniref:Uncharacterized protein n=1 Tax=Coniochaeta ligniaria NRRL 30616 TaxID=1408157 RepID=A0A1J7JKK4_9PEZI|nr:hypothetical protein CONLIGDRAFT_628831 [Coniochaeta ligniaria NRRL 30616]